MMSARYMFTLFVIIRAFIRADTQVCPYGIENPWPLEIKRGRRNFLSDGNRTYDIEEMSAGEQSVFPMLFEFVRMQIKNSVVLIDEVDLNLHPPLAQALYNSLPNIGPGCQFLLTTHSESISSLSAANWINGHSEKYF
jgi:hypothetical protein